VQCDQLKQQLRTADSHIEDLKLQLDDALGAEDMVERLTEKNLAMGEVFEIQTLSVIRGIRYNLPAIPFSIET